MSKTVKIILSTILVCACFFGLIGGAATIVDVSNDKDHWEEVGDEARINVALLQDGVNQLSANQSAYLSGLDDYKDGMAQFTESAEKLEQGSATLDEKRQQIEDGEQALKDGKAVLEWSRDQLDAGYEKYYAGVAQLEEAKAQLEAGKAELAANEAAYLEGKQKLEEATPIYNTVMPLYQNYMNTKAQYEEAVAAGKLQDAAQLYVSMMAQEAMMNAELKGYSVNGIISEYEAGQAQIAAYEAGVQKVAEAEAAVAAAEQQLADAMDTLNKGEEQYADGINKYYTSENELKEGKQLVEENEKKLEAGKNQLAEGETKLDAGAAQLEVYEDGERRLAAGMDQSIATETWFTTRNEPVIDSIAERLGDGFTYWAVENDRVVRKNGQEFVDLAKAQEVVDATSDFVDETEEIVTKELVTRTIATILLFVASVIGIVAAVFGLNGKRKAAFILSLVSAGIALVTVFVGIGLGECPMSRIAGGYLFNLTIAEIIILVIALVYAASQVLNLERRTIA